jgi:autotransporter-associated beta strand protein
MNLKNYRQVHRLTAIATFAALSLAGWSSDAKAATQYWNTSGTAGAWSTGPWGNSSSGPFTGAWVSQSDAYFGANSTGTYATSASEVGNVTVADNATVTITGSGTRRNSSATSYISTYDIGAGATLNWASQNVYTTGASSVSGFIKNGAGTWNLGAVGNPYTGGFTLNAGTIIITGANSVGTGTFTINGGVVQSTGSTTRTANIVLGGNFENAGTGDNIWSGTVSLGDATRTINNTQAGKRAYMGVISGGTDAGLTIAGAGTGETFFGNTANTFSGPVTIVNGKTVWNGGGAFGNTTSITLEEKMIFASDSAGLLGATSTLAAGKSIFLGANAGIGTVGNGVTTINGVIADKLGDVGKLTKSDTGSLILGGVNTYTGATRVSGGTLLVSNGGSIAQSSLTTVTTGTTLTANGTVGAVAVNTGGTLNGAGTVGTTTVAGTLTPGNSPGVLNVNGNLTMASGGNMVWELFANTATQTTPAVFDQVVVNGDLAFAGGNKISLNFGTTAAGSTVSWSDSFWSSNRSFLIYDVSGSTTGFSNLSLLNTSFNDATGAALAESQGNFTVSQLGSDVFLNYNAIPEPSTGTLLGFGFGGLVLTRLLRRKQS